MTSEATKRAKRGRKAGVVVIGSLPERVLKLERYGMVLVPGDGSNIRQTCLRAVERAKRVVPEAMYSVALCEGYGLLDGVDKSFSFFRILREK